MNAWTNGQKDDRWMGWVGGWITRLMNEQVNGLLVEQMNGPTNGRLGSSLLFQYTNVGMN